MPVLTQRALRMARSAPGGRNKIRNGIAESPDRPAAPRRRGRPPLLAPEQVLHEIRTEFGEGRLFRVHIEKPALYARARRLWGNWAAALGAAGLDPARVMEAARQRALETRRRKRLNALPQLTPR